MNYSKKYPNRFGIPMENDSSQEVQDAHSVWKAEVIKRKKNKKYTKMSYWQKMSSSLL